MSEHPENQCQMHERLQAYARKRRTDAGDPARMHQATRNLLLAEVRKQYAKAPPSASSWLSRLGLPLPRLAFGFGLLILLGVGIGILVWDDHRPPALELARQDGPAPTAFPPATPASTDAPPPQPGFRDERQVGASTLAESPEKKLSSPKLARGIAPSDSKDSREHLSVRPAAAPSPEGTLNVAAPLALAPNQPTPTAPEATVRYYSATAERLKPTLTEPARGAARKIASGPDLGGNVLSTFEVEQAGAQLRLIDGDGSVYEGQLMPGEGRLNAARNESAASQAQPRLEFVAESKPADTLAPAGMSPPGWNFRVRGTNRSLREPVELQGVLLTSSESSAPNPRRRLIQPGSEDRRSGPTSDQAPRLRFHRAQLSTQAATGTNRALGQLLSSTNLQAIQRIQGTLRIGSTNLIQLDAYRDGR